MVLKELSASAVESPVAGLNSPPAESSKGLPVLVATGPHSVQAPVWGSLFDCSGISPVALAWSGGKPDRLPEGCAGWRVETRTSNWTGVVSAYRAVVLLGADLSILGSLANFAGDGLAPAGAALAALAAGKPVFMEDHALEQFRRHSSRLPSGLVRRFEEFFRLVQSFGVEIGSGDRLSAFLSNLSSPVSASTVAARSSGRDVVTVEDIEAVRRSGGNRLQIALGSIVTPLASQKAAEWGIEVSFQ